MGSGSFLKVVANNFDVLAGPLVTLVYPLYASIKAIETKSRQDDQQWLTYWVLYSMITLFELTFAKVIECLPFWPYAKLTATCWLVLPYFNGAAYVYEHFIRPLFVKPQTVSMWFISRANKKDVLSRPDDILIAAEKFIEENGSEAFEKLISKYFTLIVALSEKAKRSRYGWVYSDSGTVKKKAKKFGYGWANGKSRLRRSSNYVSFDDDYRY